MYAVDLLNALLKEADRMICAPEEGAFLVMQGMEGLCVVTAQYLGRTVSRVQFFSTAENKAAKERAHV